MYKSKKQRFDWSFWLRISDAISVVGTFPLAFWISRYIQQVPTPEATRVTVLNCIFFAGLVLFFFHREGLYRWDSFIETSRLIVRLAAAMALSATSYLLIRIFVSPPHDLSFLPFFVLYCALGFGIVFCLRLVIRFVTVSVLASVRVERIAFVGWSSRLEKVLRGLGREMRQFHEMKGYFVDESRPERVPPEDSGYAKIGRLQDLEEKLKENRVSLLVVDQGHVDPAELRDITKICADAMVGMRMIPASFDIWADRLAVRVVEGIPLLGITDLRHEHFENQLAKRAVDILGAVVGLALSAPIILVLGFLIRRESPGTILYRQTRLGLRGKPFEILKLRSMRPDAEVQSGAVWTVENDPRRLKIGEFMRKWNLDELPQFWNVLRGEMSLVGPRPERPEFVEDFRGSVRYYNLRHTCKPGITGWAAVHGLRGNTSLDDRLVYDLYYISHWSLLLDFQIMLMTLAPPKNAY